MTIRGPFSGRTRRFWRWPSKSEVDVIEEFRNLAIRTGEYNPAPGRAKTLLKVTMSYLFKCNTLFPGLDGSPSSKSRELHWQQVAVIADMHSRRNRSSPGQGAHVFSQTVLYSFCCNFSFMLNSRDRITRDKKGGNCRPFPPARTSLFLAVPCVRSTIPCPLARHHSVPSNSHGAARTPDTLGSDCLGRCSFCRARRNRTFCFCVRGGVRGTSEPEKHFASLSSSQHLVGAPIQPILL